MGRFRPSVSALAALPRAGGDFSWRLPKCVLYMFNRSKDPAPKTFRRRAPGTGAEGEGEGVAKFGDKSLKTLIPEKEMKGNANPLRPFFTPKSRSPASRSVSANSAAMVVQVLRRSRRRTIPHPAFGRLPHAGVGTRSSARASGLEWRRKGALSAPGLRPRRARPGGACRDCGLISR